MKKIGIITFQWAKNYGALLQNYALLKAIEELGHSVETIDYKIDYTTESPYHEKFSKNNKNSIAEKEKLSTKLIHKILNLRSEIILEKNFERFITKYINLSKCYVKKSLYELGNNYDVLITGSDQVWSRLIINNNADAYTLNIGGKCKKASYAASCGSVEQLDDEILKGIKKLDYITVRENDLFHHLSQMNIKAEVVCDPTFLLDKTQWQELISGIKKTKNYVFVYFLDSGKKQVLSIANYLASEKNLKIRYASPKSIETIGLGTSTYEDGPLEFIAEIANADYVVVSSFHGTVFSIIFEKDFYVVVHEHTGSRVISLLKYLDLEDRIIHNFDELSEKINNKIDYVLVNKKIIELRANSKTALKNICDL